MFRLTRWFSLCGQIPKQRRAITSFLFCITPLASCLSDACAQDAWDRWKQKSAAEKIQSASAATSSSNVIRRNETAASLTSEANSDLNSFIDSMRSDRRSRTMVVQVVNSQTALDEESSDSATASEAQPTADEQNSAIWWSGEVQKPLRPNSNSIPITLETLLVQALDYSTQVKVYADLPMIRKTSIVEADAAFDAAAFLDSRWDDQNDPVGNTLTTGGANRYLNNQLSTAAGLRKRTTSGGKVEVSQRAGFQDTNSTFFVPNPQGTSKLVLNYTQPLLRGKGKTYNQSLTVLASIDKDVAEEEFSRQLQAHLLEVSRSYWGLYLERALLIQKRKSLERAESIQKLLEDRLELDAVKPQIQRAAAEVATRRSDLIRAELAVENAEARIRALVNDPSLGDPVGNTELLPLDMPSEVPTQVDLAHSMTTALQIRPEVTQAIHQIKAGSVRKDISRNELMPSLNLITEAYLSGLQNNGSVGDAFTDMFHVGGPSYSVGLQFEVPIGNRAAKSRDERRQIELRQLQHQYQTTIHTLSLEVEVAVRELETAFSEMTSQKRAVEASTAQLEYLQKRWELLPGEEGGGALMLDNLLTAQERLVASENAHTQAWITYNLAIINHQRATGELLTAHNVAWGEYVHECEGVPTRMLIKAPALSSESVIDEQE